MQSKGNFAIFTNETKGNKRESILLFVKWFSGK